MVLCRSSLHPPVFPSQLSTYSSLAGALTGKVTRRFMNPKRRHIPQYKVKSPPGCVPLCLPILFDYFECHGQGVPVHDFIVLSTSSVSRKVSGAHDPILSHLGIRQMTLHIMWQGYERLNWSRSIPVSSAISRAQLGATIAMQLWNFIEDARHFDFDSHPQWCLGIGVIEFEQIVLLGLYHIYDDIWQADLAVDTPFTTSPST